jgi:hypothetical protein
VCKFSEHNLIFHYTICMPQLNADIYALIFLHIHDFDCLRCAIEAVSHSKKHPLRDVLLRILLKRKIFICSSSNYIQLSESIISFLLENPHLAERVQSVLFDLEISGHRPGSPKPSSSEIEETNLRLTGMMQKLLKGMRGLRSIEWEAAPGA